MNRRSFFNTPPVPPRLQPLSIRKSPFAPSPQKPQRKKDRRKKWL